MELSEHVDLVQKQVRAATKLDARRKETGITDMFGPSPDALEGARETVFSQIDVDKFWLDYLSGGAKRIGFRGYSGGDQLARQRPSGIAGQTR
ncbi:hypothetical protein [Paraburkholderia caribensis]|uniref:hypothetical protein n=1 Tax=Paraburkholderia caribensis TaxID=75105 RepID=UPI0034D178FB